MAEVSSVKRRSTNVSSAHSHINKSAHIKVFLIGMMGSGKSYWAEKLKKKLKVPAYDLDNLVEIMEEKTIAEMFAQDGEEYFRKEEAKMLRLFKEKKQFILSCGGGAASYNDNMDWMNINGITIWLNERVEVLAARLKEEKQHRPLIKDLNDDQLQAFLTQKLEERSAYYSRATYTIDGSNLNENSLIKLIKEHA
jgi:shikimate kinase